MDRRDPFRVAGGHRLPQGGALALGAGSQGIVSGKERLLHQLTVGVVSGAQAQPLQARPVDHPHVHVRPQQEGRGDGTDPVNVRPAGHPPLRPAGLVPGPGHHPFPRRGPVPLGGYTGQGLFQGGGPVQVPVGEPQAVFGKVSVGIDEAGQGEPPPEINPDGGGSGGPAGFIVEGEDPAGAYA